MPIANEHVYGPQCPKCGADSIEIMLDPEHDAKSRRFMCVGKGNSHIRRIRWKKSDFDEVICFACHLEFKCPKSFGGCGYCTHCGAWNIYG